MSATNWDALVDAYVASTFDAHPEFAVWAGRHEYDGQLPDLSASGIAADVARLQSWHGRFGEVAPDSLDASRRMEREHVLAQIDGALFWLVRAELPRRSPAFYADALDPDVYLTRPYASQDVRMRAYVAWARKVPAATRHIDANLDAALPRTFIDRGRGAFGGLATFLESDAAPLFSDVTDPSLQREFRSANAAAIEALRSLDAALEARRPFQTDDFALGRERFAEMLWATERVNIPLDTLASIARDDLQRNRDAMRAACARLAPELSEAECIARVTANKPQRGPVEEARAQLAHLRAFVERTGLVAIPGSEDALVDESPPHMRWNSAYISIPGPYDRHLPGTYYIAPPDPSWSPEEQAQYLPGTSDLLFTSAHEVWPGHFLQFQHAYRARSPLARLFLSYAFVEGWAHYSEELIWEVGYGDNDPALEIGLLLNALLRNVRFVAAIALHTGSMTVEECEELFVRDAFQDRGSARQQAARGTFDPGFLNYTLGKVLIRQLRSDWLAGRARSLRDALASGVLKEFHDSVLAYGSPPIPLVRGALGLP